MAVTALQMPAITRKGTKTGDARDEAKAKARALLSRPPKTADAKKQFAEANTILYGKPHPTEAEKQSAHDAARTITETAIKAVHEAKTDAEKRRAFARALKAQRVYQVATGSYFESDLAVPIQLHYGIREATLDAGKGVARVILITEGPGNLADRHYYTQEALTRAVTEEVFEGAQCYLDHPTDTEDRVQPERSVLKLGGWYSDVSLGDYSDQKLGKVSAIFASFHPPVGNAKVLELLRTSVEYAARFPDKSYIGYSINAMGVGETDEINGQKWNRVDHLEEVVSVDIVTKAGARGKPITFREAASMAARTGKKTNREGSSRRGTTQLRGKKLTEAAQKAFVKSLKSKDIDNIERRDLYEEHVGLNREEQTKILEAAGIDGSAIAKLLDELSDSGIQSMTGVHPDDLDDDNGEEDETTDEVVGEKPKGADPAMDGEAYEGDEESEESEESDTEEAEESEEVTEDGAFGAGNSDTPPKPAKKPFGGKKPGATPAAAPAALTAARKEVNRLSKEANDLRRQLKEANVQKREADNKLHTRLMERRAEECLARLNIAEGARKSLRRQILERAHPNYNGYKPIQNVKDIMEFIRERDLELRASSRDGVGVIARTGNANGTVAPPAWKKAGF